MYFKRLSWGLNGLICIKHLKHCLPSSKCFWKRCLRIYYYTPGTVLLSGGGVKSGPCSLRAHCGVGGGAAQITCVSRVQLLREIHASCYGRSLTVGFSNRISELLLETKKLSKRRSWGRAFHLENSLKADAEGWDKFMQGTPSNSVSESLITGPFYTSGCPSLRLPLPWFIQRKSMFLYWS